MKAQRPATPRDFKRCFPYNAPPGYWLPFTDDVYV